MQETPEQDLANELPNTQPTPLPRDLSGRYETEIGTFTELQALQDPVRDGTRSPVGKPG
jgi:hypothetical protein